MGYQAGGHHHRRQDQEGNRREVMSNYSYFGRDKYRERELQPGCRGHPDVPEEARSFAQGFNSQYDAAVESLNSAIQIIKERVKNINVLVKSSEGKKETGELEASIYKKEIEELEELILEIEEKIADTKDLKKEAEAKPQDAEKSSSEAKATGDVKNVTTIAVKRKAEVDESQSKKTNSAEKTAAAV